MAAERDRNYLAFIGALPCLICQHRGLTQNSRTDAHHHGPRGYGTKASDYRAIPLCHDEHHIFGREAVHRLGKRFAEHHEIDIEAAIERLNEQWKSSTSNTKSYRLRA